MFGGSFDPPHLAHVALARGALDQLELDVLHVIPTGEAWHKPVGSTSAQDRWAMANIAFGALPRILLDDRELRRAGPSYTIDTVGELRAAYPLAELFLVIGQDQADSLTRWRDWEALLRLVTLAVAARPASLVIPGSTRHPRSGAIPPHTRTAPLHLPDMPESATEVRRRIAAGEGIAHLVPDGVARYIDQHHLYESH